MAVLNGFALRSSTQWCVGVSVWGKGSRHFDEFGGFLGVGFTVVNHIPRRSCSSLVLERKGAVAK